MFDVIFTNHATACNPSNVSRVLDSRFLNVLSIYPSHVAALIAIRFSVSITKVCTVIPFGFGLIGLALRKFAGHGKAWFPVASCWMMKV